MTAFVGILCGKRLFVGGLVFGSGAFSYLGE